MTKGSPVKSVLITGGAGFIGSNLARLLVSEGSAGTVRIIDDLSTGSKSNIDGLAVDFHEGTILDYQTMRRLCEDIDSIVHLAAIPSVPRSIANPRATHDANTTGTLNVLEAAREASVGHVVVASSSSVYGANPELPKSELTWTRPMSPYAVSKQATEAYAIAYQFSYGLKTLAFRFFNVYGPHQAAGHAYAAVIPKFLDAALQRRPVQVQGDGTQSRDFTFVDTVSRVIREAILGQVVSADPVNLAFGTNTTLLELLRVMEGTLGYSIDREFVAPRVGDVKASQADSSRLRALFPGVTPVGLGEGISLTADWFRRAGTTEGTGSSGY